MKYAFRCRTCGHLATSHQAAEAPHPHSCAVCGHGVSFHPITGIRTINKDNWDILFGLRPAELGKFGLKPIDVEAHAQWPSTKHSNNHQHVFASESFGTKDEN